MFNAVNGLGAAGQFGSESGAADNANSALYATFAVVGFFSGSITNKLGIKTAISFGGLGYSVNIAAYLCYNHTKNVGFVLFSGFLLGCCAGVLWSAQGQIMMSYPPEASKGRYIFTFWAIFNLGGVIGALVSHVLSPEDRTVLLMHFLQGSFRPNHPCGKQTRTGPRLGLYRLSSAHRSRCLSRVDIGRCETCGTHRQIARDPTEEPDLENRDIGPLGDPLYRSLHPIPVPNVLRIQLVLCIPVQCSEPSELQRPHEISQQCAVLDCADHRSFRLWLCVGLRWPSPDHTGSTRLGGAANAHICDLGRRILFPDDIRSQTSK